MIKVTRKGEEVYLTEEMFKNEYAQYIPETFNKKVYVSHSINIDGEKVLIEVRE